MASPNIAFDTIPASLRKPGRYFEFNNKLAVRTLPNNKQRVLIIAQMLASGTAAANQIVQVFDAETAAALFGRGSQAHRMVANAIQANPYVSLFVMPIADSGTGVAATATVTVTGTATANGSVTVTIGDDDVVVPVTSADAQNAIAANIKAAIDAYINTPVSRSVAANVVTLTALNKGTVGNNLRLAATSGAPGVAVAVTAFAGGLNDPALTTPLANAFPSSYEIYCVPYADATSLGALKTHLSNVSNAIEQRGAIGVYATVGTLSAATTLAAALNSERLTGGFLKNGYTPQEEMAAAYAAMIAFEEDPARPLNTLTLTGVRVPLISDRLTRTEQESCLYNGVTPFEWQPGEVVGIVRAITTYTVNAASVADVSWLDLTTIRTMEYVRKACRERISLRFPREKLSDKTAQRVRSELIDVLLKIEELEIIEKVQDNLPGLIVERDLQNVNQLNAKIPTDVVNGLHIFAGRIDLLL
jgi:phage tail sheath gpL-like